MAAGTFAYLLFAYTPALASAAAFFLPIFSTIFPFFMFLILFVTFCKVDFRKLIPVKWIGWVCLFQLLFIAVIVGSILVFHIKGNDLILMEAILTCIISPGAAAAAVVTQKLGGSLEELTTYTFISNFMCASLVPACFPLIDPSMHMDFLQSFFLILYKVCIILLVPLVLAFVVKRYLKRLHRWIVGVKDLSYYLWAISLAIVTGMTVMNICHARTTVGFLLLIALLGFILCIVQFSVGRYVGHFFHRTVEAGQALGQKNTAFAIWIAYTYLNPLSSVGPGCYILWQNIINSIEIWQKRVHAPRSLVLLVLFTAFAGTLHAQNAPDTQPQPLQPQPGSTAPPVMNIDGQPSSLNPRSSTSSPGQVVLLIGDSMCDGLGRRLADYAAENGFEFHCVVWYGSTSKSWATTRDLSYHINRVRPTFIIMSLGTNDMGYHDYSQREIWIQEILRQFGDTPYLWVGPLTWNRVKDRTIVDVIRRNTGERRFYDSTPVYCQRLDGIHPTFAAAANWVDRIAGWMTRTQLTEGQLSWNLPQQKAVFRPDAKHTPRYKGMSW